MNDHDYLPAVPDDGDYLPAPYTPGPSLPDVYAPGEPAVDLLTDYSSPRSAARPTLFGQTLPPGVSPQVVNQTIARIALVFASDMQRLGVNAHVADAAVRWYRQMVSAPVPHESPRHGYDIDLDNIAPLDRPYANAFLTHMRKRGADQASVQRMLWWFGELVRRLQQVQQQQRASVIPPTARPLSYAELDAIDARSEGDAQAAADALREVWGGQFPARMRVVRAYYKNLPAPLRGHIENAVLPNGVLAANDPETIARLYDEATGGALPSGGDLQAQIDQIESQMRSDRKAYNRNEALQHRLRRLYELRNGQ